MFSDSNIILFLLCLLPVALYSLVILKHSPDYTIKLKVSFIYLYIGLLSVTLLQFIHFIFPHIHDMFLQIFIGRYTILSESVDIYKPTVGTLILFAFFQVAFMEELSKWMALKCVDYMRGKRKKNLDHPYAIMFYACLIGASFSIVENIQYAQRAMSGEFGPVTPESVLTIRAITSVVIHMACGLFMGYYIALAKGASKIKTYIYNVLGICAASFMHGIYDYNLMKENTAYDYMNILGVNMHKASTIIIIFSLLACYLMSNHLKKLNKENTTE